MYDILKHEKKDIALNTILQAGYESLSPSTREAYSRDLSAFNTAVGKDIQDVTALDITGYIKTLESAGYKNSTINRKLYSISKIFNLYQLAGVIDKNPIADVNKVKKVTRPVSKQIDAQLDLEDIQAVISEDCRTAVIIKVLANTGLRISELINIKHSDIEDYKTGGNHYKRIRIMGKRNKERFIY